jgi:drug/metabolite transporter (DMT)-like permease
MFLWATVLIWPFSFNHVSQIPFTDIAWQTWVETAYVVVFGTFIGYILIVNAQKILRPTVVSIYNNVQPIVSVGVSVALGIAILKPTQGLAVLLIFCGVWLVTKSTSRRDIENQQQHHQHK